VQRLTALRAMGSFEKGAKTFELLDVNPLQALHIVEGRPCGQML
jgi:hypothetical protein